MPHITVEHSIEFSKEQENSLLLSINKKISQAEGGFNINACKSRSTYHKNYAIADGLNSRDFIHISVKILEGRSKEIRQNLAKKLFNFVNEFINHDPLLSNNKIDISLDISEMESDIYQKS
jgi:5-carboxymethyl-2-hydroxymuconate isomerase